MKKTIMFGFLLSISLTTFCQQEFFPGKYRQILLTPYAAITSNGASKIDKPMGDLLYTLLGSPTGEGFRILVIETTGRKLLMSQDFYFNGAKWVDTNFNSWFETKGVTLDKFLLDIFEIKIE